MNHKKYLNDYATHETLHEVIDPYEIIDEIIEQSFIFRFKRPLLFCN